MSSNVVHNIVFKKYIRRVPLVEQELLTIPEHPSSSPIISWVRDTRSLVLCVMFYRSLFVLLSFFFGLLCCLFFNLWLFWLALWYLQTLPWYWLSKLVNILKNVFFTSSECKDNIRVTNKLLSGYHHGRGNIKPASKYLTWRNLQFLDHVIITKTKVLLTQVYGTLADFIYPV